MIEAIVNFLRSQNIPEIGSNVFAYNLNTETGVLVTTTGFRTSSDIPNFYKGSLQVVVRSRKTDTSLGIAKNISDLIDSHARRSKGQTPDIGDSSYSIKYIFARHLPIPFPRSEGDLFEASVNFDVCFMSLD